MKTQKVPRSVKIDTVLLDAKGNNTQNEIANVMRIGKRTLQRAKQRIKQHGDVEGLAKQRGPKVKLHYNVKNVSILPSKHCFADITGPSQDGFRGA